MQKALTIAPYVLDVILRRVMWELDGKTPDADLLFRRQTALTATIPKIGTHMSGSAIDISVLRRDDGREFDRGGPYIELSELTPMASPFVSPAARQNRAEITALMERHGLVHYPWEFWHYSGGDAYTELLTKSGRPGRYGAVDFEPASGAMVPVPDPKTPLHSPAEIRKNLELALARMASSTSGPAAGAR